PPAGTRSRGSCPAGWSRTPRNRARPGGVSPRWWSGCGGTWRGRGRSPPVGPGRSGRSRRPSHAPRRRSRERRSWLEHRDGGLAVEPPDGRGHLDAVALEGGPAYGQDDRVGLGEPVVRDAGRPEDVVALAREQDVGLREQDPEPPPD